MQPDKDMNEVHAPTPAPEEVTAAFTAETVVPATGPESTRRTFLRRSARKIGYIAPVVLLFRPRQACASGGSQISHA